MRKIVWIFGAALTLALASGTAQAQSIAELKAQLEQNRALLAQAEASGMDESMLETLREAQRVAEQAIRELEADGAGAGPSDDGLGGGGAPTASAANAKPPVGMGGCAAVNVTAENYKTEALSGGDDVQLKTMCGQAFDLYASYKRALAQGYSEADAEVTYQAHEKAALVANDFYENNRAD